MSRALLHGKPQPETPVVRCMGSARTVRVTGPPSPLCFRAMDQATAIGERVRPHRGWAVTAACFLMAIFAWGTVFYGHSFYISQLTAAHGWPTGAISGAVTLFWIIGIPMTVTVGSLIDRFGPRPVTAAGAVLVGTSVIALGHVEALWQAYLAFAVMALGYPALGVVGISATLGPWFGRGLGIAMSFALTGASVGAMVTLPVVARIAEARGFAFAATAAGLSMLVIVVPLCLFAMARPSGHGAAQPTPIFAHFRLALRQPAFWVIAVGTGLSLMAQVGFLSHQIPILEERLSRTGAADAVALTAAAGVVGRFGLGFLAARVDLRLIAYGSYAIQALGFVAIDLAPDSVGVYVACGLSGFVVGCLVFLPPLIIRRWFGASGYGKTYGLLAVALYAFQAIGPGLTGLIRDFAGDYGPALWAQAAALAAAMLVLSRLGVPPPDAGDR